MRSASGGGASWPGAFGVLVLGVGCSPAPDRFTSTWTVCEAGRDSACDAALLEDFGAVDSTEALLDGLWELLRVGSELSEEPGESEYVHRSFERWVYSAPGDTPGESLYNRLAHDVERVEVRRGSIHTELQTVVWNPGYRSPEYASTSLVHEARHCAVGMAHVPCESDPRHNCDQTWRGAYGAELGFAAWAATTVEGWPNHYELMFEEIRVFIED